MKLSSSIRLFIALCVVFMGFGYTISKLHDLQIKRHAELTEKAQRLYLSSRFYRGKRGDIRDVKGVLFASDKPYFSLIANPCNFPPAEGVRTCSHYEHNDPKRCPKCPRDKRTILMAMKFLNEKLGIPRMELNEKFNDRIRIRKNEDGTIDELAKQYVLIAKEIDYEEGKILQDQLKGYIRNLQKATKNKKDRAKCDFSRVLDFKINYTRSYPKNEMLSNIVGFVNVTNDSAIGVAGLEKTSTKTLSPRHGKYLFERAKRGGTIGGESSIDEYTPAVPGADIFLTIHEPIQSIVEEELNKLVEKHQPKFAYIIVADPKTGDILAMAQRPTFNPNDRTSFKGENTRNMMGENIYEPGSTFKPFTVARAIDEGIASENTNFFCEHGYWFYAGKPLRDTGKYGSISVKKIIQVSSNIGTAKIAMALGDKGVFENLKTFGFGSKTNLPIRPESRGILPRLERWSKLSVTRIPIGQGIAVTPFQMVRGYCALANGGYLPSLRLLDRTLITLEPDARAGAPVRQITREEARPAPVQIYKNPASTHKQMVDMMKAVCLPGGTAKAGAIPGYHTAGKTGTAQKVENGQYSQRKYIGSFIGFAPADNPRFVMLVTVDEPKGVYYGGVVAAPFFSSSGKRILEYMQVKPDYVLYGDDDPDMRRRGKKNPNPLKSIDPLSQPTVIARNVLQSGGGDEDPDAIWSKNEGPESDLPKLMNEVSLFDESDLKFMKESADAFKKLAE